MDPNATTARNLAAAAVGQPVRIVATTVDDAAKGWLAAVGLDDGEEVTVLRRAALGGPLHVRTASGGEFAIAGELARQIEVAPV